MEFYSENILTDMLVWWGLSDYFIIARGLKGIKVPYKYMHCVCDIYCYGVFIAPAIHLEY